ncbi:MAG: hypothetical protein GY866_24195 [Proteobacteria bacterium]|nr:hypothetical protein [Pseudomonadota bacterium]
MKRFIAIAASACIFLSAQSVMAFTGHVTAGDFASEKAAVTAGKQIAQEIQAGTFKMALNEVAGNCLIPMVKTYGTPEIQVSKSWKNNEGGFAEQFKSQVIFSYDCMADMPSM